MRGRHRATNRQFSHRRRRSTALVAAAITALAGVVALAPSQPGAAATPASVTRAQAGADAAGYARSHGYTIGIAVLDTTTGRIYGSGYSRSRFASESVVKAMIATRLLLQGRMHGATARAAHKMIVQSDDGIASAFYVSVGGDGLLPWMARHYHINDLGTRPSRPYWWGNTHITPRGLVQFYAKVKRDPRVGPWLIRTMHQAHRNGSDGTYQFFGLKQADPRAAIKQGWGADFDDWSRSADFNSTGYVDGNRYAVAILARGPIRDYGAPIANMLTHVARLLLPHGQFPDPIPRVGSASTTTGRLSGGQLVTLHGSAFTHVTGVTFGTARGTRIRVLSGSTLQVITPAHRAGRVSIRVATQHGTSGGVAQFTYVAPATIAKVAPGHGPAAGGTSVRITGGNFRSVQRVLFDGVPGRNLHVGSTGSLSVLAPAHAAGTVDVRVVTGYGTSALVPADRFTYDPSSSESTAAHRRASH
jgi:hypothetical protein